MSGTQIRLVVNIDDVGMCHGANAAFIDLARAGRCDSGSVMVPCPWFLEIAEAGREDPALPLGIHLTLTSEKRHYRWRPLTAPSAGSGLIDEHGFFWRSVPEVRRHADPAAVETELRAQIDRFLAAGLKPTHIDAHMGAALAPEFLDITIGLGRAYGVPILMPRGIEAYGPVHNLGPLDASVYGPRAAALEAQGAPVVDRVLETPWHEREPAEHRYRRLFDAIGPGLNFMALHANAAGEIEAIEPASARIRIDEYAVLKTAPWMDRLPGRRGTLASFGGTGEGS